MGYRELAGKELGWGLKLWNFGISTVCECSLEVLGNYGCYGGLGNFEKLSRVYIGKVWIFLFLFCFYFVKLSKVKYSMCFGLGSYGTLGSI